MTIFLFWAMAVMGQQSPPENLAAVIQFEKPSFLFETFYGGTIVSTTTIRFVSSGNSILLAAVSVLMLFTMLFLFRKKASSILAIGFGILFVCSAYSAIMFGIK
jgi:putative copper resistance protein D